MQLSTEGAEDAKDNVVGITVVGSVTLGVGVAGPTAAAVVSLDITGRSAVGVGVPPGTAGAMLVA